MSQIEMGSFRTAIRTLLANPSSSSLSNMTGESFEYHINHISIVDPKQLDKVSSHISTEVCAVLLKADGDIKASMLFYLAKQQAKILAARLLGKRELKELDTLARSSISEVGNILFAGSFLNALCKDAQFRTNSSTPGLAIGQLRGLIEGPICEIGTSSEYMVMADSELVSRSSGISLRMLLVMSEDDARRLICSVDYNDSLP